MDKSGRLGVNDVCRAYRLIGECRDLGRNPNLWYPHLLQGVSDLVGADAAVGGEGRWGHARGAVEVVSVYDTGFDARGRDALTAYHRDLTPSGDPIFNVLGRSPGRLVTLTRREMITDAVWYRSACFDYHRLANVDHQATSVFQFTVDRDISVIAAHRGLGKRDFSQRERRLLDFFHSEVGPLIGHALVTSTEVTPERLPPRLRQTLALLLEGESEKSVAARLELSPATVHQYVTALYRRFGVSSRAELMAHAIRRLAMGAWQEAGVDHASRPCSARPECPTTAPDPDIADSAAYIRETTANAGCHDDPSRAIQPAGPHCHRPN
jgi:DNA-binding CsgD family transcriptional regulator